MPKLISNCFTVVYKHRYITFNFFPQSQVTPLVYPLKFILDCCFPQKEQNLVCNWHEFGLESAPRWEAVAVSALQFDPFPIHIWAECFHRNGLLIPQVGQTKLLQFKEKRKQIRNWSLHCFPPLLLYKQTAKPRFKTSNPAGILSPSPERALQGAECCWPVSCRAGRCDILPRSSEGEYDIPLWAFWIQKSLVRSETQSKSF